MTRFQKQKSCRKLYCLIHQPDPTWTSGVSSYCWLLLILYHTHYCHHHHKQQHYRTATARWASTCYRSFERLNYNLSKLYFSVHPKFRCAAAKLLPIQQTLTTRLPSSSYRQISFCAAKQTHTALTHSPQPPSKFEREFCGPDALKSLFTQILPDGGGGRYLAIRTPPHGNAEA